MRKLIVKYFALNYICNIFGKTVNFVRAANIIFPLMCLTGAISVITDSYPVDTLLGIVSLTLTLLALFLGFFYFQIKPVEWHELDISQKWQYGKYKTSTGTSLANFEEWVKINKDITNIYETKKFYNIKPLLVNILVAIITIIIII